MCTSRDTHTRTHKHQHTHTHTHTNTHTHTRPQLNTANVTIRTTKSSDQIDCLTVSIPWRQLGPLCPNRMVQHMRWDHFTAACVGHGTSSWDSRWAVFCPLGMRDLFVYPRQFLKVKGLVKFSLDLLTSLIRLFLVPCWVAEKGTIFCGFWGADCWME